MAGREPAAGVMRWLVDASNVIGSRPDGWWRDRAGATARLLASLEDFAAGEDEVVVVLDAGAPSLAGRRGRLEVVLAPRRGRDAADDEIVARLERDADPASVTVVTSDRALAERARSLGASVDGAKGFRDRLQSH
jgi:predicted RNA-binding protein with PIN domain